MAGILRGEIRWADLNPVRGHEQAGLRPVMILSHDIFNERSGTVIAVAITSQAIREAVGEKLTRMKRNRLSMECAKLEPAFERAMAEEGLAEDVSQWPEY